MRTTAFISHCWRSGPVKLKGLFIRLLTSLLLLAVLFAPLQSRAQDQAQVQEGIDLKAGSLSLAGDGSGWVVSAEFQMNLSPSIEEAVSRGLVLYFVTEFELIRPRWYWRDERAITARIGYRLAYHALSRQYRLSVNGFQTSYSTLREALLAVSTLRGWRVAESDKIKPKENAEAWLRLRLDTSQLPKPFQVGAINNRDWNPESTWKRIQF